MLDRKFYIEIEKSLNDNIIDAKALTDRVTLLSLKGQKMILKEINKKTDKIYDYLASVNFNYALFPVKKFIFNKKTYYLFTYLEDYSLPSEKKITMAFSALLNLQEKTKFSVTLSEKEFKYFYRIYKRLDKLFTIHELFIRECEMRQIKTDFDWIVLSKCHIFLDAKEEMYRIQRKIHKYIDNKGSVYYSLNHGNFNLEHFVQNKIISFENAYVGIFVSDLARFYVSLDHYSFNYEKLFSDYLASYNNEFYLNYFKFLVLYIYILNLEFDTVNYHASITKYIQISRKVSLFLHYFSKK